MQYSRFLFLPLVCVLPVSIGMLNGCAADRDAAGTMETPPSQLPDEVDPALFEQATVVVRASMMSEPTGNKYLACYLRPHEVLKNVSGYRIAPDEAIFAAFPSWETFPNPDHHGVVYLVPLADPKLERWKVIGLKE